MLKRIIENKKGVTLLELTVAVAIFSVVVLSAMQIFKMVIDGQQNAIAGQNLQESMRYALEVMSKEIRMAQKGTGGICYGLDDNVYLTENGVLPGNELYLKSYKDECVRYQINNDRLKIERDGTSGFITPDEIAVSDLEFIVTDIDSDQQARVTILMDVEAVGKEIHKQSMKIQTTISSRYYE
jgi:prepilin-type N-terminal cleavage/methylation domain-containing protein